MGLCESTLFIFIFLRSLIFLHFLIFNYSCEKLDFTIKNILKSRCELTTKQQIQPIFIYISAIGTKSVKHIIQYSVVTITSSLKNSILFSKGSLNGFTNPKIASSIRKLTQITKICTTRYF